MSKDNMDLENEEELDLVSLIAGQGEEHEEEEEEDLGIPNGDLPDDPDELKQMLIEARERDEKRKFTVKKKSKTNSRLLSEIDALKSRLDELQQNRQTPATEQGPDKADLERQAQEWAERVENDPVEAIRYADWKQQKLEENLGSVLVNFEKRISEQIAELRANSDPERQQYRKELEMLKTNPELADLGDTALLKIAKTLKSARNPRGSIGGQRAVQQEQKPKVTKEDLQRMGFGV